MPVCRLHVRTFFVWYVSAMILRNKELFGKLKEEDFQKWAGDWDAVWVCLQLTCEAVVGQIEVSKVRELAD